MCSKINRRVLKRKRIKKGWRYFWCGERREGGKKNRSLDRKRIFSANHVSVPANLCVSRCSCVFPKKLTEISCKGIRDICGKMTQERNPRFWNFFACKKNTFYPVCWQLLYADTKPGIRTNFSQLISSLKFLLAERGHSESRGNKHQ